MNFDNKDIKCDVCRNCGQKRFKVSAKFKGFVQNSFGNNRSKFVKFVSMIFSQRSSIVHTGNLLTSDELWHRDGQLILWDENF